MPVEKKNKAWQTAVTNITDWLRAHDLEEGQLWTTISIQGTLEGCTERRVEVDYHFYKKPDHDWF